MNIKEILNLTLRLGFHLLESGAEIYRVEQSVKYICEAYGYSVEVFAIPSSLIITVSKGEHSLTKTKRIVSRGTDLDKVEQLTTLSRYLCAEKPDCKTAEGRLCEIMRRPAYPTSVQYAASGAVAAVLTLFFGGGPADSLAALLIGLLITWIGRFLNKLDGNPFLINILCGACAGICAYLLSSLSGRFQPDKIVIGTIMLLVPGMALANSIRDFIGSDIIAGICRLAEALLTAVGIAIGVAVALMIL